MRSAINNYGKISIRDLIFAVIFLSEIHNIHNPLLEILVVNLGLKIKLEDQNIKEDSERTHIA